MYTEKTDTTTPWPVACKQAVTDSMKVIEQLSTLTSE